MTQADLIGHDPHQLYATHATQRGTAVEQKDLNAKYDVSQGFTAEDARGMPEVSVGGCPGIKYTRRTRSKFPGSYIAVGF